MRTLARIVTGIWILFVLMVIGIVSVNAHTAAPPEQIRNWNPRLESADHWTEDGWHYHQWCYDLEGINGLVGTWQDAWEVDDLAADPPPPRDPDPPDVEDTPKDDPQKDVDPPDAADPPKRVVKAPSWPSHDAPPHIEHTDGGRHYHPSVHHSHSILGRVYNHSHSGTWHTHPKEMMDSPIEEIPENVLDTVKKRGHWHAPEYLGKHTHGFDDSLPYTHVHVRGVPVDPPKEVEPPKAVDPPRVSPPTQHMEMLTEPTYVKPSSHAREVEKRVGVVVVTERTPVMGSFHIDAEGVPANIILTQVMFHDWGKVGGRDLPQWFELHNRGGDANLEGYTLTFQVRTKDFGVYKEEVIVLKDFQLSAGETMIVTRRRVGKFLGHLWGYTEGVEHIYIDEGIPNLKNRWTLTDPNGKVVYRRDVHWNYGWGPHENRERKAFSVIPSEPYTGEEPIYYGSCFDRGNPPGFHRDVVPEAPQLRRKRIGMWGDLKRQN